MRSLVPKVSRSKGGNECERILLEACEKATKDGRPFTITAVNDSCIGVCSEFTIWYWVGDEVKP